MLLSAGNLLRCSSYERKPDRKHSGLWGNLNRTLQLSDEALVDTMQTNLTKQGYGFDSLVETIVLSPQFRNKRTAAPPTTQLASGKVN